MPGGRFQDLVLDPDTRANQPAATAVAVGTLYCVTDENDLVERSNGTTWDTYSPTATAPTAHASEHENGGGDEIDVTGLSGLLADGQTPVAHKTSHQSGGSDAIKLDDLAAPDDNTDLDVSIDAHGLTPKLPNDATKYFDGTGAYTVPATVSDSAYAGSWDGVTSIAPSKNAVYDKIEAVIAAASALVSDTAYAGSWDGVTTMAPSKNAVYDKIETLAAAAAALISDTAYDATAWDGVTTVAPSKNAVRDKIEALITAAAALVSDTAYAGSWDGVTTIAPSKNAVYDKIETLAAAAAASVSDTAYDATSWDGVTTIAPSKNAVRDKIEAVIAAAAAANGWCARATGPALEAIGTDVLDNIFRVPFGVTVSKVKTTARTGPSGSYYAADILYSTNQGASWASLFSAGDTNKAHIAASSKEGDQVSGLAVSSLAADTWLRIDVIQVSNAADLEIVIVGAQA